jgi:hypothetical protein
MRSAKIKHTKICHTPKINRQNGTLPYYLFIFIFPNLYLFVLLLSYVKLCQLTLYMYIHTQVKLKSVHDVKSLAWMTREKLQVNKVH